MNWKEIKEKYPKAFNQMNEWYGEGLLEFHHSENRYGHYFTDGVHIVEMWNDFLDRNLYDFFDENEIWIDIDHEFGADWTFTIDNGGNGHDGDGTIYKTRTEAETAAFTKAFEILEEKLIK